MTHSKCTEKGGNFHPGGVESGEVADRRPVDEENGGANDSG
ncbi:hypothetical protein [Phormidium sp. CCY1219]|nr:hypothetical protein [Phormidium sp. CCY1219]